MLRITQGYYLRMVHYLRNLQFVEQLMIIKAYLRCGTSEGLSRPLHTPVQLSGENLQFKLPSSHYPQECGYVSPGVILLVNDMKEVSYKDRDRYAKEDVTVTVTCKPKLVYPSTAGNLMTFIEFDICTQRNMS